MLVITTQYSEEYLNLRTNEHVRWETVCENHYVMPWFTGSLATARDLVECIRDHIEWNECSAREVIVNVVLTDEYPEAQGAGQVVEYDLKTLQYWYENGEFLVAHYNRADFSAVHYNRAD